MEIISEMVLRLFWWVGQVECLIGEGSREKRMWGISDKRYKQSTREIFIKGYRKMGDWD